MNFVHFVNRFGGKGVYVGGFSCEVTHRSDCIACFLLFVQLEIFALISITHEELQIFTYTWHLWSLNSESSLACHYHCDTGHSHLMPSVWQWSCHYLLLWLRFIAAGIRTPNLPRGERSNRLRHRRCDYGIGYKKSYCNNALYMK